MAREEPTTATTDARRRKLLEAAFVVFTRYGFRKSSMDEVARAAQVSRQGLYLHFATKEDLFRATLEHALSVSLDAARAALADESAPVESRLVRGLDEWVGRYVGAIGAGATDLGEFSGALAGPMVADYEAKFVEALAKALRASGLAAAYKPAGLTARQLAETLHATARGAKYSESREVFIKAVTIAVKAMCLPLLGAS